MSKTAAPAQTQAPAEVTKPAAVPETVPAPKTDERSGQVLRIKYSGRPDSKGFGRLLNFLAYFHGNMPVEVLFESDKSITRLDDICRIQPDEAVLNKLAELVGEDNIEIL